jgi:group I intron endonuclease
MPLYSIYKIINLVNNKIYIGKTGGDSNKRLKQHIYISKYPGSKKFSAIHSAIAKYGESNFVIDVLNHVFDEREAYLLEQKYIETYESNIKEKGYNLTGGGIGAYKVNSDVVLKRTKKYGNSRFGKKHTEETKKKISESLMGEKHPFFGVKGKLHPSFGKKKSLEQRDKLRKLRLGKKMPEEFKIKLAKRMKENPPRAKIKREEIPVIFDLFNIYYFSIREISDLFQVTYQCIYSILKGKTWNAELSTQQTS